MPALTNFKDKVTNVVAAWLNMIDVLATTVFQQASTNSAARNALMSDAPLEIVNGGTASRTAAAFLGTLGAPIVQNSLLALRAFSRGVGGPTTAIVLGSVAAGDGGGGIYYFNAADTTSADNGGTLIVSVDNSRWYKAF